MLESIVEFNKARFKRDQLMGRLWTRQYERKEKLVKEFQRIRGEEDPRRWYGRGELMDDTIHLTFFLMHYYMQRTQNASFKTVSYSFTNRDFYFEENTYKRVENLEKVVTHLNKTPGLEVKLKVNRDMTDYKITFKILEEDD